VTALDMALPTFLTAWGEERISSSAAGILTATDPLFTAVPEFWLIRSEAVSRKQFAGLLIGFAGVIALLGVTAMMTLLSSAAFLVPAAVNLPARFPPTKGLILIAAGAWLATRRHARETVAVASRRRAGRPG
jgi:EamA-like transporter family